MSSDRKREVSAHSRDERKRGVAVRSGKSADVSEPAEASEPGETPEAEETPRPDGPDGLDGQDEASADGNAAADGTTPDSSDRTNGKSASRGAGPGEHADGKGASRAAAPGEGPSGEDASREAAPAERANGKDTSREAGRGEGADGKDATRAAGSGERADSKDTSRQAAPGERANGQDASREAAQGERVDGKDTSRQAGPVERADGGDTSRQGGAGGRGDGEGASREVGRGERGDGESGVEGGTSGGDTPGDGASGKGDAGAGALEAVGEVRDALRELVERFDREDGRAAHRESVIDRLHEENQRLRRGEIESMLEPVRAALYKVHDTLRQAAAAPPGPEQSARLLGDCANEVADALARTGAVRFEVEPGQPYDASRHRPLGVEEVDDPDRAGTVVAVLADGFEMGGRVVRKAGVRVGKSVKSTARRRPERDDGHRRSAR
ncbi:nucleotide exchange factor GrpE [Actinomadura rupiterrae]|uniref:nucleotide exchange factor GrpE n=1 Tax=Actinomadura rupiterrae TaxID=559627 RepID=UPI0020A5F225|nr:nucleotide exchange factor GrpE [Actinomadura rupiterrae]MCP2336415.1 molecular chaperone GrpE (heat shock protein) [Actinomadura rupiterrae]